VKFGQKIELRPKIEFGPKKLRFDQKIEFFPKKTNLDKIRLFWSNYNSFKSQFYKSRFRNFGLWCPNFDFSDFDESLLYNHTMEK
jgi:hypothetical protein